MESTTCAIAVSLVDETVVVTTEGVLDGEAAKALVDVVQETVRHLGQPVRIDLGPIEGWTSEGITELARCGRMAQGRALSYSCGTARAREALLAAQAAGGAADSSRVEQHAGDAADPLRRR